MSNAQFSGPSTTQASVATAGSGGAGTRPAHWPSAHEFNEAIQNLAYSMSDDELKAGEPAVNKLGLPMPYSGAFADIYRVHCPATGDTWAVKCFTRVATGLQQRYAAISQHLKSVNLPFTVDFDYVDQGVRIGKAWYPIVKMRWIEGLNLNAFVAQSLQHPATLDQLFDLWVRLANRLRLAGIAHADLQHGNVLLVQRPGADRLGLRLIDYDGMYVPALAGQHSGELGHPAYQHPQRLLEGTYSRDVDRFSHLSICCALRALRFGGRELWDKHDNGQNLLFVEQDFAAPGKSELFRSLWKLPHPDVRNLVGRLALATQTRLEQTPAIDELMDNGHVRPLSDEEANAVRALLEPAPPPLRRPDPPVQRAPLTPTPPAPPASAASAASPAPPAPPASAASPASPASLGLSEPREPSNGYAEPPYKRGLVPFVLTKIDDWLARIVHSDEPPNLDLARCALILIVVCGPALLTMLMSWATTGSRERNADADVNLTAAQNTLSKERRQSQTLRDLLEQRKAAADQLTVKLRAAQDSLSQEQDRTRRLSSMVEQFKSAADDATAQLQDAEAARDAALRELAKRTLPVSVPPPVASLASIQQGTQAGDELTLSVKTTAVRFRWCPPGTFKMGSPVGETGRYSDEGQVSVTLTRGFWLMETECWQKLWVEVMGAGKTWDKGQGDRCPAYDLSHNDAVLFAKKFQLTLRQDGQLPGTWFAALPTEAQWEYAVRGGSDARFCFGDDETLLGDYAWYDDNSGLTNQPVGTKKPNAWGIRDGHGSLHEWTSDLFASMLVGGIDPTGPATGGNRRVIRGGSWFNTPRSCRSAARNGLPPEVGNSTLGFRLALQQSS